MKNLITTTLLVLVQITLFAEKNPNNNWEPAHILSSDKISSCPNAAFTANIVTEGSATTFTDMSTYVSGSATYAWDFDNNGTIDATTVGNTTYTYPIASTYTAKLMISDGGCSSEVTMNVTVNPAGNLNFNQLIKKVAADRSMDDWYGHSVSISGEYAVVGALDEDGTGINMGAAYILKKDEGGIDNWNEIKKITASDTESGAKFGHSVFISGDYVVVGALNKDDGGVNTGAAYIFNKDEGGTDNWGEVKKITASDAQANDNFGQSVSIYGDYVAVGALNEDAGGSNAGAAYIFSKDQGGTDNWGEVKKITASDAQANDFFGQSITISDSYLVVGAYGEDGAGADVGAAYIFGKNESGADNWGEITKITASDAENYDWFGYSLSISGSTLVVGARREDGSGTMSDAGAAYVYQKDEGGTNNWGEVKKLIAADAESGDFFGESVAISGSYILIGANGEDENGSEAGAIYFFAKDEGGSNNWGEVKKLTADDGQSNDFFGFSVAISGTYSIVGAYANDDDENDLNFSSNAGAAYIFKGTVTVVPVSLTYFEAQKEDNYSILNWQTASELDNEGFYVQHSTDGNEWSNLDFIDGQGTINEVTDYSYTDYSTSIGLNYYRLQQVDFDGQIAYSDIQLVSFENNKVPVSTFPNPFNDYLMIENGQGIATIYNLLGQPVQQMQITNEVTQINTSALAKGTYILVILKDNGEVINRKLIK